jgi:N-acetylglucosamine-6-phosphate deacetylase
LVRSYHALAPIRVMTLATEVADHVALIQADYQGETARGRLAPGAWADIVVLDKHLQPVAVFVEGEAIDLTSNPP